MSQRTVLIWRWVYLLVAYALFGYGINLTINADLGVTPWDVLHIGLTHHLPLSIGQSSMCVGATVVLIGWFLGVKPYWGTLANVVVINVFVDLYRKYDLVPTASSLPGRLALFLAGLFLCAVLTAVYTSANLGNGPRDGFMLGLTGRLRWQVGTVRNAIEIAVTLLGWAIGGPVGIGTVLAAVLTGPFVQVSYRMMLRLTAGNLGLVLQVPEAARLRLSGRTAARGA